MGMTEFEILRKVEMPLAIPTIMAGIRGATIAIVATATIAPLAGVLTLGDFILNENVYGDNGVLAGAIVVALLALVFEFALAGLQRRLTSKGLQLEDQPDLSDQPHQGGTSEVQPNEAARAQLAMLLALALAVGSRRLRRAATTTHQRRSGGGGGGAIVSNPDNAKVSLTIGSKNFPEQEILGEIYAQALEAAGYKVKTDLNLGSETVALKTLKAGQISGYPEYASHGADLVLRSGTGRSPRRRDRSAGKRRTPNSKKKA